VKIRSSFLNRFGGLMVATLTARWMSTLEYRGAMFDPTVDPALPGFRGPIICIFWHEYIPFLFYLRPNCSITMLLSRHQDAELLGTAARYMGFSTVRGSTNRGGAAALRELVERGRVMNLAITPDGPRGPRRTLAPGAIFVASKLGLPLVPVGLGYQRPWRLPTWDRFALPRPFSRARGISGPRIHVPADLDRRGLEYYRQYVESVLNQLTTAAEEWADSGQRMAGEFPSFRQPQLLPGNVTMMSTAPTNRRAA